MGNTISNKIPVDIRLREYETININIPYEQLQMIRILQREFTYEVNGTFYVDHNYKFVSFEVRTDNDEFFSSSASDWKITYHTHPDNAAQKYGLRYYSPPSVDDVMGIFDHCREYTPDNVHKSLGEIMVIFANEGIYVLQVNRTKFMDGKYNTMTDDELEAMLNDKFNPLLVQHVSTQIANITNGVSNIDNPDISADQFIKILHDLTDIVNSQFPFEMDFYGWSELKKGLNLKVNTYFVTKKVID